MNDLFKRRYKICDFSIETQLFNKYIDEYFYYRFFGFFHEFISLYDIDLCIKETIKLDVFNDLLHIVPVSDDLTYDIGDFNINIINYKNYIVYNKITHILTICLQEKENIIEKIMGIKLVSTVLSLLLQKQIFCIHGSCIKKTNTGILLLGNSGSGKTSLSLNFIADGATMTNDDATFIKYGNGFVAIKNTQMIGLTDDGIRDYFSYLSESIDFIDENKKNRIDLYKYNKNSYDNYIEINKIIWISSDRGSTPLISELKKTKMIKNICTNISVNKYLYYDVYLKMITELVFKCDNYILHPSNDLTQTFKYLNEEV